MSGSLLSDGKRESWLTRWHHGYDRPTNEPLDHWPWVNTLCLLTDHSYENAWLTSNLRLVFSLAHAKNRLHVVRDTPQSSHGDKQKNMAHFHRSFAQPSNSANRYWSAVRCVETWLSVSFAQHRSPASLFTYHERQRASCWPEFRTTGAWWSKEFPLAASVECAQLRHRLMALESGGITKYSQVRQQRWPG